MSISHLVIPSRFEIVSTVYHWYTCIRYLHNISSHFSIALSGLKSLYITSLLLLVCPPSAKYLTPVEEFKMEVSCSAVVSCVMRRCCCCCCCCCCSLHWYLLLLKLTGQPNPSSPWLLNNNCVFVWVGQVEDSGKKISRGKSSSGLPTGYSLCSAHDFINSPSLCLSHNFW